MKCKWIVALGSIVHTYHRSSSLSLRSDSCPRITTRGGLIKGRISTSSRALRLSYLLYLPILFIGLGSVTEDSCRQRWLVRILRGLPHFWRLSIIHLVPIYEPKFTMLYRPSTVSMLATKAKLVIELLHWRVPPDTDCARYERQWRAYARAPNLTWFG